MRSFIFDNNGYYSIELNALKSFEKGCMFITFLKTFTKSNQNSESLLGFIISYHRLPLFIKYLGHIWAIFEPQIRKVFIINTFNFLLNYVCNPKTASQM